MRLKWEERIPEAPSRNHGPILIAFLVEETPDTESPREPRVTTLASIEKRLLQINIRRTREFHHGLFWQAVARTLKGLELSLTEQEKIEAAIEEKVPRPSDDCWALWGVTCIPRYER